MLTNRLLRLAIATAVIGPGAARADDLVLDYPTTIRLAAERAPAVIAARGHADAARGRRAGARARPNPELEAAGGRRWLADERWPELEVRLEVPLEIGGRRGARIAVADAELASATATAADAARQIARDAGLAFYRALAAEHRFRLATDGESVAATIAQATDRRVAKGDVLELDANLARAALGRARASVRAAEADREAAFGALRTVLALDAGDTITLRGDLAARRSFDAAAATAAARQRPDLDQLAAEARAGAAQLRLGRSLGWPEVRIGAHYGREEDADVVLGGLAVTLPVFDRGQEHRGVGRARLAAAKAERDALARSVDAEVAAALAAYRKRVEAVAEYETTVNPLLDETERVLRRGYEVGQLSLADYLVARRELLDARTEYVQRILEAAEAGVEVDVASGVMP